MVTSRTTNKLKVKKVPHVPVAFHKVDDRRSEPRTSKFAKNFHDAWRPAMGWLYGWLCLFDFFVAPILWPLIQTVEHQQITQWQPITLSGAGLMHISFAAIVGVTAWSRGKEKASPWAMVSSVSNSGTPPGLADDLSYIDPERRFANART